MARKLQVEIVGDSRSLERALGRASAHTDSFGSSMTRTAKIAAVAGAAIAGATAGGLAYAAKKAIDFDREMRNVNSIAKLSERQFGNLKNSVLALAGPTAQSPKVLAQGLYDIVSSGFKAKDATKILAAAAKAASAGLTDTATSTKAVTAALNAYHRPATDARKVSDVLFQTVNKGVLTFEELAQNMGDLVPAAAPIGVSLEEVGAAMATVTLQGVPAAEAATRVKNTMLQLAKPSAELSKLFKENGYQSGEAATKALGFSGILKLIQRETKGSVTETARLTPEIRALLGVVGITGKNLKTYESNLRAMNSASKGAGATQRAFAEQAKSVSKQWEMARSSIEAVAIRIGDKLLPAFNDALKFFNRFLAAKGFRAKLEIVWEGVREAGVTITEKVSEAIAMVDWTAVWSKARGIAAGLKDRFESVDWRVVGQSVGSGIAESVKFSADAARRISDELLAAARSIDWVKLGKAMGPGIAAAVASAIATFLDPVFWIKNWDLALAIGLTAFGGVIGRFAGSLATRAAAPLARAGGELVLAIVGAIERLSPRVASALLAGITRLPALVGAALRPLTDVVGNVFGRLGTIATFTAKVLGIQVAIDAVGDLARGVANTGGRIVGFLRDLASDVEVVALRVVAKIVEPFSHLPGKAGGWARATKESIEGRLEEIRLDRMVSRMNAQIDSAGASATSKARAAGILIGSGLSEGAAAGIMASAERMRSAAIDAVDRASDAAKQHAQIRSPSVVWRDQIGRQMAEGMVQGILDGKIRVSDAAANLVQAAADRARTKVQATFGNLQTWLQQAFNARQGAKLTPTEILINKRELERQKGELTAAIGSAQSELAQAQEAFYRAQSGQPDPITGNIATADDVEAARQRVVAAQKALEDAHYQQWLFGAQRQAEAERKDLENRQFVEQQAFQQRLENLQAYLESGHATAAGAKARILDLMHDFGIQASNMGQLLGAGFARGIRRMVPLVAKAAEALRIAAKNEGILLRGREITIRLEEKADKKQGAKGDRPVDHPGAFPIVSDRSIDEKLWDELGLGQSSGLSLTSGYRPGAVTTNGTRSKHSYYPSKAIDMAGSAAAMGSFARSAMGRPGIDEVFYDPLGYYMDRGTTVRGSIGGHSDHVHVGVFDRGGFLQPGWNLAGNFTGRPEPVGAPGGGGDIHVHLSVHGPLMGTSERDVVDWVMRGVEEAVRRDGQTWRLDPPGF